MELWWQSNPAVVALVRSVTPPTEEARAAAAERRKLRSARAQPGGDVYYLDRVAKMVAEKLDKADALEGFERALIDAVTKSELHAVDLATGLRRESTAFASLDDAARWPDVLDWLRLRHSIDLSDQPMPAAELPVSRSALIARFKHVWPTIETDLKNASRRVSDSLSAAARSSGKRGWLPDKALDWAKRNNKLKPVQPKAEPILANWLTSPVRKSKSKSKK